MLSIFVFLIRGEVLEGLRVLTVCQGSILVILTRSVVLAGSILRILPVLTTSTVFGGSVHCQYHQYFGSISPDSTAHTASTRSTKDSQILPIKLVGLPPSSLRRDHFNVMYWSGPPKLPIAPFPITSGGPPRRRSEYDGIPI